MNAGAEIIDLVIAVTSSSMFLELVDRMGHEPTRAAELVADLIELIVANETRRAAGEPGGSTMTTTADQTVLSFAPPGPGTWERDNSHCPPSATPLYQRVASTTMTATYRDVFARWGAPLDTMEVRFVHGRMYRRLVPLVGADRTGPPPPRPVLWAATRLHPAFRRREQLARQAVAERPYLDVVNGWLGGEREAWVDRNLALQAIDPAALDDGELAHHLEVLDDHLVAGWMRHHELHGSDLGPIGDLLAHGAQWGLEPVAVMELLRGASPATLEGRATGGASPRPSPRPGPTRRRSRPWPRSAPCRRPRRRSMPTSTCSAGGSSRATTSKG